jgi:fatty acid desaturase
VNGCSFYNWCHQHFLGHHPFTNVQNELGDTVVSLDPDTVTADKDIRRIRPSQPWLTHYIYQHLYAPVMYGLLGVKFRFSDFVILFVTKMNGLIRVNPMDNWHLFNFFAGKLFFLIYRIVVPASIIGWAPSLLLFFFEDLVTSWILALVFQVNHVIELAVWPVVDKNTNTMNMDWAEMQLRTTLDYAHHSPLTAFLTGHLNYQVTHHLFPYISQIHYPQVAPIIKAKCKKYGLTYNELPTFYDALSAHLGYLKLMGNKQHHH